MERRFAQITEAASLLLPQDEIQKEELSGVLADVGREFLSRLTATEPSYADALPMHLPALHQAFLGLFENDMAFFAERITSLLARRSLLPTEPPPKTEPPYRVAYVSNPMTEAAFRTLLLRFPDAVPLAAESFRMAAEAVTEGRASACFLPMEDASLHRIPAFFQILDAYNLSIVAEEAGDSSLGSMHYALLSYHSLPVKGERRRFSCRYIPSEATPPGAVLRAAAYFGLSPLRFSMELTGQSERPSYFLSAACDGGDAASFLTYLYLFSASVSFYGVYA